MTNGTPARRRPATATRVIDMTSPRSRIDKLVVNAPGGSVTVERGLKDSRSDRPMTAVTVKADTRDGYAFNGINRGATQRVVARFIKLLGKSR